MRCRRLPAARFGAQGALTGTARILARSSQLHSRATLRPVPSLGSGRLVARALACPPPPLHAPPQSAHASQRRCRPPMPVSPGPLACGQQRFPVALAATAPRPAPRVYSSYHEHEADAGHLPDERRVRPSDAILRHATPVFAMPICPARYARYDTLTGASAPPQTCTLELPFPCDPSNTIQCDCPVAPFSFAAPWCGLGHTRDLAPARELRRLRCQRGWRPRNAPRKALQRVHVTLWSMYAEGFGFPPQGHARPPVSFRHCPRLSPPHRCALRVPSVTPQRALHTPWPLPHLLE